MLGAAADGLIAALTCGRDNDCVATAGEQCRARIASPQPCYQCNRLIGVGRAGHLSRKGTRRYCTTSGSGRYCTTYTTCCSVGRGAAADGG